MGGNKPFQGFSDLDLDASAGREFSTDPNGYDANISDSDSKAGRHKDGNEGCAVLLA